MNLENAEIYLLKYIRKRFNQTQPYLIFWEIFILKKEIIKIQKNFI